MSEKLKILVNCFSSPTLRQFIRGYPITMGGPDSVIGIATRNGLES